MPKKPTDVELKIIKEMFEASVDGQPYDTERWGQYFRPAGVTAPASNVTPISGDDDAPAAATTTKPTAVAETPAWEDEPATASAPVAAKPASSQKAEDILAMIRSRQTK
jgi:hypothetical protein